jgi:hypothetical protein
VSPMPLLCLSMHAHVKQHCCLLTSLLLTVLVVLHLLPVASAAAVQCVSTRHGVAACLACVDRLHFTMYVVAYTVALAKRGGSVGKSVVSLWLPALSLLPSEKAVWGGVLMLCGWSAGV